MHHFHSIIRRPKITIPHIFPLCWATRNSSKLVILFLIHRKKKPKSPGLEEVLSHCTTVQFAKLQNSGGIDVKLNNPSFLFSLWCNSVCISWLVGAGRGNTASHCVRLEWKTLARLGWVGELLQTPHGVSVFWSSAISVKWGLNEVLPCLEPVHAPIPRPRGALALIPCCHKQQLELLRLTGCLHNPFCQLRCYFPEEGCSPSNQEDKRGVL